MGKTYDHNLLIENVDHEIRAILFIGTRWRQHTLFPKRPAENDAVDKLTVSIALMSIIKNAQRFSFF